MLYDQFIKEVSSDFYSLFPDFEEELLIKKQVESFDEYFNKTTGNEELIGEIIIEAERFGLTKEDFITDLYDEVKNFGGKIELRIKQLELELTHGRYRKEEVFEVKTSKKTD